MIRKIFLFLFGFMLLVIIFVAVFLAGAIFNTAQEQGIKEYFWQTNISSELRSGAPESIKKIPQSQLFDMLIQRYVNEYFYVLPDIANIQKRELPNRYNPLVHQSSESVFDQWVSEVAPTLEQMAKQGILRTVKVTDIMPYKNYYVVYYQFKTWYSPNNMSEVPTETEGVIQLKLEKDIDKVQLIPNVEQEEGEYRRLMIEANYDPMNAFVFKVIEVIQLQQ